MEYGVNVTNKFANLGEDEDAHDPSEVLTKAELAREKEKLAGTKTALKKPVPAVVEKKAVSIAPQSANNKENMDARRNQPRNDQNRRGGPVGGGAGKDQRGPRGPRRQNEDENHAPASGDVANNDRFGENRPPRQPRGQNFERRQNTGGEDGANRDRGSFGRGGGAGGGGGWHRSGGDRDQRDHRPRGPRNENAGGDNNVVSDGDNQTHQNRPAGGRFQCGPRNGPRGDRISGSDKTGVRSVPKRDGHGKGNWGTDKDAHAGDTEPTAEGELNNSNTDTNGGLLDTSENANPETQPNVDEEAELEPEKIRELTLEEWKAQQKSQKPNFNIRKAGEGDDAKIYQKLVLVQPRKEEHEEEEEEEVNQNKRETREKHLNIEVSFSDSMRNRGGFREERGGRDYRGGGDRGDRGGNFERGENRRSGGFGSGAGGSGGDRGGARSGGFAGGRRNFNNNNNEGPGGSGTSGGQRRPQQQGTGFNLNAESFPALGAR